MFLGVNVYLPILQMGLKCLYIFARYNKIWRLRYVAFEVSVVVKALIIPSVKQHTIKYFEEMRVVYLLFEFSEIVTTGNASQCLVAILLHFVNMTCTPLGYNAEDVLNAAANEYSALLKV